MAEVLNKRYRVHEEVGRGGMAVVYKGDDLDLGRSVAIKILYPHLAADPQHQRRFHREANAVAALSHVNIINIYDYSGVGSEQSYIVTEFVDGCTLREFVTRHQPKLPEISVLIAYVVAGALSHAHSSDIIHRDVKPENIMIGNDGVLKLMDFGIARSLGGDGMTVTGTLVGSPAHMSPEHVEGKELDPRADVFSLGTLLYWLSTGRLPFAAESPHALLRQILEVEFDDPRRHNESIGRELHGLITRAMAREPDDRFASMAAFQQELGIYLESLGISEPADELQRYFASPLEEEPALTSRVVSALIEKANRAANAGKVAVALEAYNQVLSLEGDRKDALHEVQRLSRARSRREIFRWGFSLAMLVAIVGGLTWHWITREPPTAPVPNVMLHAAAVPASILSQPRMQLEREERRRLRPIHYKTEASTTSDQTSVDANAPNHRHAKTTRSARTRKVNGRVANLPSGPQGKAVGKGFSFTLFSYPPAAELHFDGQVYRGRTPKITRAPGNYRVRIHYPDCAVCVDRIYSLRVDAAKPPPSEIRYTIGFKPARLTVLTVPGAHIRVAGRDLSSGVVQKLPVRKRKEAFQITVSAKGYSPAIKAIYLEAGKDRTVRINLIPLSTSTTSP